MSMAELTAKNGRNWKINVKRKEHSGRTGNERLIDHDENVLWEFQSYFHVSVSI
jgi:hypothetical protein